MYDIHLWKRHPNGLRVRVCVRVFACVCVIAIVG